MLFRNLRKKNAKTPQERNIAIARFIVLFIILGLLAVLLASCAQWKDPKRYEMKKSPCACFQESATEHKA